MKKTILIFVILAAGAAVLVLTYREMSRERTVEAESEKPVMMESRVRRGRDGEVSVSLDADTRKRLGLQLATPEPAALPREVKAYGRVLDPAPMAPLLADMASSASVLEASRKELQRVRLLFEQGENASRRSLEAAEAAVVRDQINHESAQLKLAAAWGRGVAGQPDLPGLCKALVAQQAALVRLDLAAGDVSGLPSAARLFTLAAPDQPIEAQYLGPAVDVDRQTQGAGFLFLVKGGESSLRPGQALVGRIQQPGEHLRGVRVPASAVIRAGGKAWVYVRSNDTTFARRPVPLDNPTGDGWLVTGGITAKDTLVVTGAQMLFSEELKSRLQLGD